MTIAPPTHCYSESGRRPSGLASRAGFVGHELLGDEQADAPGSRALRARLHEPVRV
jgi:hypothetical protein